MAGRFGGRVGGRLIGRDGGRVGGGLLGRFGGRFEGRIGGELEADWRQVWWQIGSRCPWIHKATIALEPQASMASAHKLIQASSNVKDCIIEDAEELTAVIGPESHLHGCNHGMSRS